MARYWLTPPEMYESLDKVYHFDNDPCPYPLPNGFDGLKSDWGKMNYVNPIFRKKDSLSGKDGPTAFVRKAIEEQQKGNSSLLTIPTQSYVNMLLNNQATAFSLGRVRWLDCDTKEPMKGPSNITAFFLKGHPLGTNT